MNQEAPVEQLATAPASEEFWNVAKEERKRSGLGGPEGFTQFLLRLGERLEEALALLPSGLRDEILAYLNQMGKCLAVKDLARIVGRSGERLFPGCLENSRIFNTESGGTRSWIRSTAIQSNVSWAFLRLPPLIKKTLFHDNPLSGI